ncbi:ATP-binding protein [Chloroflexota bacterium]
MELAVPIIAGIAAGVVVNAVFWLVQGMVAKVLTLVRERNLAPIRRPFEEAVRALDIGNDSAAIILAFTSLESLLRSLQTPRDSRLPVPQLLKQFEGNLLSKDDTKEIHQLTRIRNQIAHTGLDSPVPAITADEYLSSIRKIRDSLEYKLETDYQFKVSQVDLILKETAMLYAEEAGRRGLEIRISLMQPALVELSPVQFKQVISFLLDNAIKYSIGGSEIKRRHIDILGKIEGTDYVLTFTNQGIKIPSDERELILKQDWRRRRSLVGTGMGLEYVKRVVDKHNGIMEAASIGQGNNIYLNKIVIRMPLRQSEEKKPK